MQNLAENPGGRTAVDQAGAGIQNAGTWWWQANQKVALKSRGRHMVAETQRNLQNGNHEQNGGTQETENRYPEFQVAGNGGRNGRNGEKCR